LYSICEETKQIHAVMHLGHHKETFTHGSEVFLFFKKFLHNSANAWLNFSLDPTLICY
jgi:hypothetical protein